ncbi:dTTP/UTP pyrophosphatase [Halomonadaceae bacterium LMG 33818]|uniref:Maf family protein n=1 Tax=Cernens ardua TaxID=3402176 RepID=UPI003EDBCBD5
MASDAPTQDVKPSEFDAEDATLPPPLCLASASPRRLALLKTIGVIPSRVIPANIDESVRPDEAPHAYVARMAAEKASTLRCTHPESWIMGADTTVVAGGIILGKPADEGDFCRMFQLLNGQSHQVHSAVALLGPEGQSFSCLVTTTVTFAAIPDAERDAYWATGEPADKAGGYAIQGVGAQFVTDLSGSYSAVVGLPLYETSQLLKQAGWRLL